MTPSEAPRPPLILVVEDQANVLKLIGDVLRQEDYAVVPVTGPAQASELFPRTRPDLVLLDLHFPEGNGLPLLSELRALEPGLPVVILTGHGSPELVREAMIRGAFDFLTKPFDRGELVAAVARGLASARKWPEVSRV